MLFDTCASFLDEGEKRGQNSRQETLHSVLGLFQAAAVRGHLGTLQALLEQSLEEEEEGRLETRDASGRTALCLAALASRPGCVAALLEAGCDAAARDASGMCALDVALELREAMTCVQLSDAMASRGSRDALSLAVLRAERVHVFAANALFALARCDRSGPLSERSALDMVTFQLSF